MITILDPLLDRITSYRLVLYVLLWMVGIATILSFFDLLPFSPTRAAHLYRVLGAHLLGGKYAPRAHLERADEYRIGLHYRPDPGSHHRPRTHARRSPVSRLGGDPGDGLEIHSRAQQQAHLQSRRHRRGDHLVRLARICQLVGREREHAARRAARRRIRRTQAAPGKHGGLFSRRRAGHGNRRERHTGGEHPA